MRRRVLSIALLLVIAGLSPIDSPALGALTAEHRKEINEIKKDVSGVTVQLRKKEYEEAERVLNDAEQRLKKIAVDAEVDEDDRALQPVFKLIEGRREVVSRALGKDEGGISFAEQVAPILAAKCISCHGGNEPRGTLRLETFAGMKQGGQSGQLLVPGNPNQSRIMARLLAPQPQMRMPRGQEPLAREEIQTIAAWIQQGARFDGTDEATRLTELKKKRSTPQVEIAMATGSETVSFTRDIAPFMSNICGRCHRGNNPRGEFSVETFEKLMIGGESGQVIVPGKPEESRLWRLVNADEEPVMPQGQALITRKNHTDLRTWIQEGAKFDGGDARKLIAEFVPTEEQLRAEALGKLTPEEFRKHRLERTKSQWKRTLPNEEAKSLETEEFLVYGNVSDARLQQVADWAEEQAKSLRTTFSSKESPLWKGRLAILVFKERFGYEEFNRTIHSREAPREVVGHSYVTPGDDDALIALEDIGDAVSATSPGLKASLAAHMTGAFLERGSGSLPDWLVRGTGLALAARLEPGNAYNKGLIGRAVEAVRSLQRPEEIFNAGTFSPADTGPVGYTMVDYMLQSGGPANFGRFVQQLKSGGNLEAALRAVYRTDQRTFGTGYARALATGGIK